MQLLRERIRIISIVTGSILLLSIVQFFGGLAPIERGISVVIQPIEHMMYSTLNTVFPLYTSDEATLVAENSTLKEQLAQVVSQNEQLETELDQYKEYKDQLAFAQTNEFLIVPAEIISRVGQDTTAQIITINKGSDDGVQEGYPIMYSEGVLLGTVYHVTPTYSEIALITGGLVQVQGQAQNESHTSGLITGEFGTSLRMDLILKDKPLVASDLVTTNGHDRHIPAGLVLGSVQTIEDESSELFKTAILTPIVRYDTHSIVSVIVPN